MDGIQNWISEWAEKTFQHDEKSIAAHLLSEAAGLYTASGGKLDDATMIVADAKMKKGEDIADETADVIILALTMAGYRGFSARQAVMLKMNVNKARQWGERNAHGFAEHIPENVIEPGGIFVGDDVN